MMYNLKRLLLTSRPISWPNTVYPFAATFLVTHGQLGWYFWISTLYFLLPYNLLMYGVNDVFDYESDIRNPRKGGIEGAQSQKAFHPVILLTAAITNIPFLVYMLLYGTWQANCTLGVLIFFVLAYSIAGLRFKEVPILDSATSSTHFVGPMIYALVFTGFETRYLPYVVAFFLWGLASHAFGAVQDIIPDREGHMSSVATILGARRTIYAVLCLYFAASILVITKGLLPAIVGVFGLSYVANVLPYMHITDETSGNTNKGWRHFIWLNMSTGFIVTMVLIVNARYG